MVSKNANNQVPAGFVQRIAAQAVIAAQRDDDDCGLVLREYRWNASIIVRSKL